MTQQSNTGQSPGKSKTGKIVLQLVSGALLGGFVTFGFLTGIGDGFDKDDPSRVVGLLAGLVFILMGGLVGIGTIAPRAGAFFLNVEDSDELREQTRTLLQGSITFLLAGAALLVLSLTSVDGSPGAISVPVAAVMVALCFGGLVILTLQSRDQSDELMKQVGMEASALSLYASMALFGIWAALSHLGYIAWVEPLAMISGLLLISLAAIFVVSARKGLLRPR